MKIKTIFILLMLFKFTATFNPIIEWSCGVYAIYVDIKTDSNFNGVAHSTGHRSNCFAYGKNTTLTEMVIPMVSSQKNPCGVKIDQDTEIYSVEIEVHKDIYFSLTQDRYFNITCKKQSSYFDNNATIENEKIAFPNIMENINFELLANDHSYLSVIDTVTHVKHGESYAVKVSLTNVKCVECFRVTNCMTESEGVFVELSNSEGCSKNEEFKDFIYKNESATALIPSFFKVFDFKILKLECKIEICDHPQGCQTRCDSLSANFSDTPTVTPAQIVYTKIHSLKIHVLDETASIEFFKNKTVLFIGTIIGLVLIVGACTALSIFFNIKYRIEKEFVNNFFHPFHSYRNSASDAPVDGTQTSRRSSVMRIADHMRRISSSITASPRVAPSSSSTQYDESTNSQIYIMEMTPLPQNFRKNRRSSVSSHSYAETAPAQMSHSPLDA